MRREIFRMNDPDARALLLSAPYLHLAATGAEGEPIVRALNIAPLDDGLCFHGAPVGEKLEALGRRCVLSAVDHVATVPSTFSDPERACPATTLYRSVQVHGRVELVEAPLEKARALQAIMERFQPEGGHVPLDPAHARYGELYEREVQGVMVCRVVVDSVDGKAKLAQNRTRAQRQQLLARLWERGAADDLRALELVAQANATPREDLPLPLQGPEGVTLHAWLDPSRLPELAALHGVAPGSDEHAALSRAHLRSSAWVGAVDLHGRLVASARALADGQRCALLLDRVLADAQRGGEVERALDGLLRAHPAVRGCARLSE